MRTKPPIELDDARGRSLATEEFLHYLHRSSELLSADQISDAQESLQRAFHVHSDDAAGQATLALVYFKLGLYPRALELYQRLIAQHTTDPVLRLNLALVYFKTGQTSAARDELQEVVRLNPDYRKAYGYLGLAHERLGEYQAARRAFRKAGADHLAQRMARFVEPDTGAAVDDIPSDSFPPPLLEEGDATAVPTAPLPQLARAAAPQIEIPDVESFYVQPGGQLTINVIDRIYTRLSGLLFSAGEGLSRRPLDPGSPLGQIASATNPFYEIRGDGRLGLTAGLAVFTTFELEAETAYLREDVVFACSAGLDCERAQLLGTDLSLAHFRGTGTIVLRTSAIPQFVVATTGAAVHVTPAALLGWSGNLAPRAVTHELFDPPGIALEFVGEGRLLIRDHLSARGHGRANQP